MSSHSRTKLTEIIGWREWVKLPELGIPRIKVKVDTGARSSCLHAFNVREFERNGKTFVHFAVHPVQRNTRETVEVEAEVLEFRLIRSSNGQARRRPVIVTTVELLGQSWPVELTLANRDEMGFRMLLGREAVRGRFLVDSGRSFFGGTPKVKRKSARKPPARKTP